MSQMPNNNITTRWIMMSDLTIQRKHSGEPSTPSTASTGIQAVEAVEGVEITPRKCKYEWQMEAGLDHNFREVGRLLASLLPQIYRHPDNGLLLVEDDRPRRIASAKELAPLVIDNIRISVTKKGKYQGEKPSDAILNNMISSRNFLSNFRRVEEIVTTPVVLADHSPSRPGFNSQGGVLYLGPAVADSQGIDTIKQYLDVVDWHGNADRTNAVAAALTVPFRHRFSGGKPFVLVTATKSHAGKGTLIEFIRGKTAKAEISYEDKDWPMQRNLHEQLLQKCEIGVINFDNVRTDSSGRARIIRTGFLESFITNSEIVLSSATSRMPLRTSNKFVVLLNTNEGSLSTDLLNRSLPIRLEAKGDLTERIARVKGVLGGDVKHEWLPANQNKIQAELWGMIDRWLKEGQPLDKAVRHPMGPWAATIGGILMVNGFSDFLANYSPTRAVADPIREDLGILAFSAGDEFQRVGDLANIAVAMGLQKTLLSGVDPRNEAARQRAMGRTLAPFVGETFTATTASDRILYRLKRKQGRFEEQYPHFRYAFEEFSREPVTEDAVGGLVLEEASRHEEPSTRSIASDETSDDAGLTQYQPEVLPT